MKSSSAKPKQGRVIRRYKRWIPIEVRRAFRSAGRGRRTGLHTREIAQWSAVPVAFVTTALREGTAIYERPRDQNTSTGK
jgi:hypothetical protein